jgi:hypothetical protein
MAPKSIFETIWQWAFKAIDNPSLMILRSRAMSQKLAHSAVDPRAME